MKCLTIGQLVAIIIIIGIIITMVASMAPAYSNIISGIGGLATLGLIVYYIGTQVIGCKMSDYLGAGDPE